MHTTDCVMVGIVVTVNCQTVVLQAVELVHKFEEEPLAVALHPSGLYALIAFAERAKLCAILMGT
jgi:hypothetical protein